ncbi:MULTISPECIES: FecCD family ABC transporter permease [Alphaproteobacteria]|uniref:Iron ABC transporter permease n=2 Tax=Alphaproteobacteria TaxID=28211 RepID=A0A512HK81_9HYPH|nr:MULTISPECIES: iron ABC transporter permease [Alphaproteobacteria]GEO85862.1 iron ABC transporter permease [Ciceribacter naphthalenivorans]GLR21718.1 iron ABC transporter permease [Ciceribacter naphthalenivorans]GLT04574.1 iron ABC transporter permease [Sphingomonas psychrolutea]
MSLASAEVEEMRGDYRRASLRKTAGLWLAVAILVVLMLFDLTTGPSGMPLSDVWNGLLAGPAGEDRMIATILWQLRMPQTVMGVVVGACLGLAGLQMQTILDNPLASPFTLGFSAAAGFGAALAIMFGGALALPGYLVVPIAAFAMTLFACGIVYAIARLRGASPEILVLGGIAVSFFFQSLQSLLQFLASPEVLQQIVFWLFGSLLKATWTSVAVSGAIFLGCLPFVARNCWALTVLKLGDANARSLGLSVERMRRQTFLLVALLTAAAVSFVGTIGFVGLIAPHVCRMAAGEDHRFALPLSAVIGAIILVGASVLGKFISPAAVVPVGIVTAIAGIPMLFAVIFASGRKGGVA